MKNISLFLSLVITINTIIFTECQYVCEENGVVKSCIFFDILVSIENVKNPIITSDGSFGLPLVNDITMIAPFAFKFALHSLRLPYPTKLLKLAPESFYGLEKMENLRIGRIELSNDTFKYTPNLKNLDLILSQNTKTLSNKFKELVNLVSLKIYDGKLETIEADTFILNEKLSSLTLASCQIWKIEVMAFCNLRNLKTLNLSGNSLMKIDPDTFRGLKNLEVLDLSYNNIYRINKNSFKGLININDLIMSNNDIIEIKPNSFYHVNMKNINLQNNRLKIIEKDVFHFINTKNSRNIDLSQNSINQINDGAFSGLNLNELDLSSNKLTIIKSEMFQGTESIHHLNLIYNDLTTRKCFSSPNIDKVSADCEKEE